MTYNFTSKRLLKTPMPDANLSSMASLEKTDNNGVATPSLSYQRMRPWWDVIEAVRGGTSKMRELGEAYLPREPGEGDEAYHRRLSRVVLAPWYTRLVRGLVGMVLRKPIRVEDDKLQKKTQELLKEHLEDINLQGDNLQTFAKDVFESAIDYNYSGILVEYPDTSEVETQADELALGVRPYWVLYQATDILRVKWHQVGSQRILTQVRLKQRVTEDDGEFGEAEIEQVMVYDLGTISQSEGFVNASDNEESITRVRWRIFRESEDRDKKKVWVLHDQGLLSLSEIPFAICYTDKKCRLELQPPMLEVAYLNLKHYQLSADLDHALTQNRAQIAREIEDALAIADALEQRLQRDKAEPLIYDINGKARTVDEIRAELEQVKEVLKQFTTIREIEANPKVNEYLNPERATERKQALQAFERRQQRFQELKDQLTTVNREIQKRREAAARGQKRGINTDKLEAEQRQIMNEIAQLSQEWTDDPGADD